MGFQYISISVDIDRSHARIQRGDKRFGPPPPPPTCKNHKKIEFLSNTGPDPLKFSKLPSQHSTLGHHRHASETPFKRRFAGGPMMVRFLYYFDPLSLKKEVKKRYQSSDPDQIRKEIRKECFVNLNIWACDRKHAKHQYCRISDFVVQKPMRTRSISMHHFQH